MRVSVLVGRATGANDPESRNVFIGQSLRGTVFVAIAYCLILILSAPIMPDVVGLSGTSAEMMESYLDMAWIYRVLSGFWTRNRCYLHFDGKHKVSNAVATFGNRDQCLSQLFRFTLWSLALRAPISSGVSRGIASIIGLYYIQRDFAPKWIGSSEIMRMVRIGTPIAIGILSYALVYWALLKTSISPLGEPVNATLELDSRLLKASHPYLPGLC